AVDGQAGPLVLVELALHVLDGGLRVRTVTAVDAAAAEALAPAVAQRRLQRLDPVAGVARPQAAVGVVAAGACRRNVYLPVDAFDGLLVVRPSTTVDGCRVGRLRECHGAGGGQYGRRGEGDGPTGVEQFHGRVPPFVDLAELQCTGAARPPRPRPATGTTVEVVARPARPC